ncbi:CPBP family intramembrane glutamic endopeptidase [Liquorilactobacillus mali]|uniref:CAAX family protease n=1 Tax=Liquorilactobacillus mali KCTC 3596 = DSM 20444 TaxID=1046596 RepID=J0USV8_9LACO|nr:type II CAAX endopeptidase family protein [Liquorilactobacillus mali]EJF00174.1 Membrane-bound protease, CAAX family protein [Liquorilactobacillus mali KCTC 3596 = DSM 20444]KRN08647.1 CAAX family protease [Liquorilactobacillus mali KCTC 3596 = DSM 20444]QFQ74183.1 CPBP family intramembrane metalloprotease [Liquorilactobacillus mali]
MDIRKNSLALLITYLVVMLFPNIFFTVIKSNPLLFIATSIMGTAGIFFMFYLNRKFPFKNNIESKQTSLTSVLLLGLLGTILVFVIQKVTMLAEIYLLHQSAVSENTSQIMTIIAHYPYYLIYVIVAAPVMEEFIFRKVFFGNLSTFINPMGAALFSSVLFSIAHADEHYLTYACLGLVLSFIYYKAHDIKAPIIAHILMNLFVVVLQLK